MTHTGIEAFLAIVRCKSITRAADALCICQSSISIRLQNLEKELGHSLFVRQKGQREITLTPMGKEFYELAIQYEKLMEEINTLCSVHRKRLSVSALNSLGSYLLPESYERFMQKFPDVELNIQDFEVEAACKSILQGQTDIAFNTEPANSDKIVTAPIFYEPMKFICSVDSDYGDNVALEELSVKNEVFVDWFIGFSEWHANTFGKDAFPKVCVNIMSQLKMFTEKKNNWAIVPLSVAKGLSDNAGVRICGTRFEMPKRRIHCLYSAEKKRSIYFSGFMECLSEVFSRFDEIEKIEFDFSAN